MNNSKLLRFALYINLLALWALFFNYTPIEDVDFGYIRALYIAVSSSNQEIALILRFVLGLPAGILLAMSFLYHFYNKSKFGVKYSHVMKTAIAAFIIHISLSIFVVSFKNDTIELIRLIVGYIFRSPHQPTSIMEAITMFNVLVPVLFGSFIWLFSRYGKLEKVPQKAPVQQRSEGDSFQEGNSEDIFV